MDRRSCSSSVACPLHHLLGSYVRLHAVSLDGESPREIVSDFLRDGSWRWVAGHPDGRISALGTRHTREYGFFTVSRGEGQVTISKTVPLGADPVAQPFRFQWNAAGTMLYLEADTMGTRSLWRVRVDPKTLEWRSAERLTMPAGQDVAATLSRDGTRLAFSQQQEVSRIWVFPIDTMGRPRVVGEGRPLTEDGAKALSSALSPDGVKVAYELRRPGTDRSELWVQDLNGGARELLAINAKGPVWSRDGTSVAYSYIRLDKQPLERATAYRPLGGVERFLTSWGSDVMFGPADWTPGRSALGTFMSPFRLGGPTSIVLWPGSNPKAVRPERTLMSSPPIPNCGQWGRRSPRTVVGFFSRCCDSTRPASSRWSPRRRGRLNPHGSASRRTTTRLTNRGGPPTGRRSSSFRRAQPLISMCGRPASIQSVDSRLASPSL